ncbi:DMT family transporter [Sneathiella sp.]|uniref:DMT family transporter n=1 Tax=Sneathiella sp. TaxID=1964365 RepID=UPI003563C943
MVFSRLPFKSFMQAPVIVQAIILMIAACLLQSIMAGLIRSVADSGMPIFQVVFLRNVAGLLFILPWLAKVGLRGLKTKHIGLYLGRGVFGFLSMIGWFYAISVLPLADAVALNFTAPIFGTILAIFILHEVVGMRRGIAMIVGFAGAMILLRPGLEELNLGSYAAIFSALGMAVSITFVKLLSRTESTPAIVAWTQILILPMSLFPALFVWETPTLDQIMTILVIGLLATVGHLCFTKAYSLADASVVMPFDFFRLIFSAIIGFIFFMQVPDVYTYIGAAVIFSSSIYIAIRESRRASAAAKSELLARTIAETRSGPVG